MVPVPKIQRSYSMKFSEYYKKHKRKLKKLWITIFVYSLVLIIIGLCFLNYKQLQDKNLAEYKLKVAENQWQTVNDRMQKIELFIDNFQAQFGSVGPGNGNEGIWLREVIKRTNNTIFQNNLSEYQRELQKQMHGNNKLRYTWMINPVENAYVGLRGGEFGTPRWFNGEWFQHTGLDQGSVNSKEIKSACDGIIDKKGFDVIGGYYVIIKTVRVEYNDRLKKDEELIYENYYGHLSQIDCEIGQNIKQGDRIGLMGQTGKYCDGIHLHWSIKRNGLLMNPIVTTTWHNKIIDFIVLKKNDTMKF